MARLVRGLLVTIIAFTLAFGTLAIHRDDASAAWSGYWTYNAKSHTWVWTWVWVKPGGGVIVQ